MSWFWLALVIVFFVTALYVADDLYTYGWGASCSRTKVWLMGVLTAAAVLAGVPLIKAFYRLLTSSGSSTGVAIWVALVITLAVDAILAHDVGRACKKLRKTRPMTNGRAQRV